MTKISRMFGLMLVAFLVIGLAACGGGGGGTGPSPVASPVVGPPPMGPPPVGPFPTTVILTVDHVSPPSGTQQRYGAGTIVDTTYRMEGGNTSDKWCLGSCVSIDGTSCVAGSETRDGPLQSSAGEYTVSPQMYGGGAASLGTFTSKYIIVTITACNATRVISPASIKTTATPCEITWVP